MHSASQRAGRVGARILGAGAPPLRRRAGLRWREFDLDRRPGRSTLGHPHSGGRRARDVRRRSVGGDGRAGEGDLDVGRPRAAAGGGLAGARRGPAGQGAGVLAGLDGAGLRRRRDARAPLDRPRTRARGDSADRWRARHRSRLGAGRHDPLRRHAPRHDLRALADRALAPRNIRSGRAGADDPGELVPVDLPARGGDRTGRRDRGDEWTRERHPPLALARLGAVADPGGARRARARCGVLAGWPAPRLGLDGRYGAHLGHDHGRRGPRPSPARQPDRDRGPASRRTAIA